MGTPPKRLDLVGKAVRGPGRSGDRRSEGAGNVPPELRRSQEHAPVHRARNPKLETRNIFMRVFRFSLAGQEKHTVSFSEEAVIALEFAIHFFGKTRRKWQRGSEKRQGNERQGNGFIDSSAVHSFALNRAAGPVQKSCKNRMVGFQFVITRLSNGL